MRWLDRLPLLTLLIIAVPLALAPFAPEPHVWEKLKMLANGQLTQAVDILDLLMHATPSALLVIKLVRMYTLKLANT
jgi:hypothetical protein